MKSLILSFAFALLSVFASAQSSSKSQNVKGYTKKNGTYVEPHHRSSPDKTEKNNYSTKGNTNPYTGKKGTKNAKK